jgi:hypothetical protein
MAFPWALIPLMIKGTQKLGTGLGFFKTPEEKAAALQMERREQEWKREQQRRESAQSYLQRNYPDFKFDYQFDPAKYEDILAPARESQAGRSQALFNKLALTGRTGGTMDMPMQRQARQSGVDYNRLLTQLKRTGEQEAFQRAMAKYGAGAEKVKTIASYI